MTNNKVFNSRAYKKLLPISNLNSDIKLALNFFLTLHKFQIHFYLSITSALDEKTIVSIDDEDKKQYHQSNSNTSK